MLLLHHEERRHLHRALQLARDAAAFASPNPTVGCVLTAPDGSPLAEGAHFYDARDHAEIAALKQAASRGLSPRGATAFVTLEPCSHHGRTGPCADALIAAGIARCVVATQDPNPAVSGQGLTKLRAAGIETLLLDPAHPDDAPLIEQARRLNDAFAFSIQHHRPFVTLKSALSVDGRLAPAAHTRTTQAPVWLTGPAARADVQHLRHHTDALLTGIGTVLSDNPALTDRTGLPRRRPLLRVLLDTHLRTPPTANLFSSPSSILILCSPSAPAANEAALQTAGAEVLRLPNLDPATVLAELHRRLIRSVLLEAGPHLNAAFLAADLVDQLILYCSETELGPHAVPFAANGASPFQLQQHLLHPDRTSFPNTNNPTHTTEDIRIRGYLHLPWPT